jgi:replicative DNA helicase
MSKEALMERAFANTARINLTTIRTGRGYGKPEYSRLTDAMAKIARSHLHIDDSRGIAFAVVKSRLRRLASKGRIACVIIDYHQRVNTDGVRGDTRDQVLTRVAEGFRNLAQEFDAPVILLAALNREVEKGTKRHPQLSDLRECGGLEAEADTVIFIHRPEVYDANAAPGLAEFVIAKQRQGEIGVVKLRYVAAQVRFEDWVESRT